MNRFYIPLLVAALALSAACSGKKKEDKQPVPVTVESAQSATARNDSLKYSATVLPFTQINLLFKQGGYVDSILQVRGPDGKPRNIGEGDYAEQGTVLAQLRAKDYVDKVRQAKGLAGEADAAFSKAESDYNRAKALYDSKSLTRPDFDAAQAAFDAYKSKQEAAHATLDEAQTALDDSMLKSPLGGVILKRAIETGQLTASGTLGFVVADISTVKAVFGVPDTVAAAIRQGGRASVYIESIPGAVMSGIISRISPSADQYSRVFEIEVTLPNRQRKLKPGMIASIDLGQSSSRNLTPTVPVSAVIKTDNSYAVFIVESDGGAQKARLTPVKTGAFEGNRIEVLQGIKGGEKIVVQGANILSDGDPVRIIE